MNSAEEMIQKRLFELQDLKYREFNKKLIPTVDPESVIGVRTPDIRRLAKELWKTPEAEAFLKILPHTYYEENNLHGFLLERIPDYHEAIKAMDAFLPYIDNWATCDCISPKAFKKHLPELYEKIKEWIGSGQTYTVRFGIGMLMRFFLDENFIPESMELVAGVKSGEYYVNMMIAWYFATALAKQYETAFSYIKENRLEAWTHNKAIQKAVESYRVTDAQKACLKTLKRKA